jgi:hypothetical protein
VNGRIGGGLYEKQDTCASAIFAAVITSRGPKIVKGGFDGA